LGCSENIERVMIMMALSIILMLIAAGLLIAESMVPDFGIMGITGLVLLVVAAIATVMYVPYGAYLLAGELAVVGTGVFFFIRRAKRKQAGSHFILKETLNEDAPEHSDLQVYVGKHGLAKTSLRPFGVIDIGGTTFDVTSEGPYIEENSNVQVIKVSAGKLVVKQAADSIANAN
jgi:membrane-bound serine protease (ClpP class)